MRCLLLAALAAALFVVGPAQAEAVIHVEVTRDTFDLYRVEGTAVYVQTASCFRLALNEPAVLIWQGRYARNVLYFPGDKYRAAVSCKVIRVLKEFEP